MERSDEDREACFEQLYSCRQVTHLLENGWGQSPALWRIPWLTRPRDTYRSSVALCCTQKEGGTAGKHREDHDQNFLPS